MVNWHNQTIFVLFCSFGMVGRIIYCSWKAKRIQSIPFYVCMLLCVFLLMDVIMHLLISYSLVSIDSHFFNTNGVYPASPDGAVIACLVPVIMFYFQWNVINGFKSGWNSKQKSRSKTITNIMTIVMLIIHVISYAEILLL